jgi:HD-like signal output (HDOD) protein/nitrogen-specific signal transduction histidine kinase
LGCKARYSINSTLLRSVPTTQVPTDARLRLGAVRLPALPEVLLQLLQLFRRDDAGLHDFTALIAQDAGITARLLAVANSAAYRGRGAAPSLERAMAALGTDVVKTLVISQSIFQTFSSLPAVRKVDLRAFWRHSLVAALAAREAARHLDHPRLDEAYLAGLLHDIGRLGLLAAVPERYADAFHAADSAAQCEAERRGLQLCHAEAGAWLAERWQLDVYLADSLRYHHEAPVRLVGAHPLIRAVAFAHVLAEQPAASPAAIEAGRLCGLDPQQVAELASLVDARLAVAADQLGLDLGPSASRASLVDERLMDELAPMVVAATVLKELPPQAPEAERLQRLADAARILFQFSEVVVMLADPRDAALRWVGAAQPALSATLPPAWLEFTLPIAPGSRIGDGLQARRPVFVSRHGAPLSVAEDQLLRLLGTEQLVCLPLRGDDCVKGGALVCTGDADLLANLAPRQDFLLAFAAQADAARQRAAQLRVVGERRLADQVARQLDATRRLAHEVNNPLSIIQNYLALLDAKAADMPGVGADIRVLQDEVARVGRLVQSLSDPHPSVAPGAVDPNRLIDDVARLFSQSQQPGSGIEVLAVGRDAAPSVQADGDALKQILVNLVKNAIEAMPGPGRVVLANNGLVNLDGRLYLELSVRDDGPGLPTPVWSRLFTAGARTSSSEPLPEATGRRGLGLSIVHELVVSLGGLIQCRSGPMGTSFDVLLPHRSTAQAAAPRSVPA